ALLSLPSMRTRLPDSTLFPYTTLFRSLVWRRLANRTGCRGPEITVRIVTKEDGVTRWVTHRIVVPGRNTIEEAVCRPRQSASARSEEHTSELQSRSDLVCRLLLEKKKL